MWGALGPSFAPVLVVVVGLDPELRPDLLPATRGGCFLILHPVLDHSLAVVEAMCILLVAIGKVAVLEVVIAKVASTSVAVVIVASLLEVVDVKVASLPVVVRGVLV